MNKTIAELDRFVIYVFILNIAKECIKPVKVEQKSGRGVIRIDDDGGAGAMAVQVTVAPALVLLFFDF